MAGTFDDRRHLYYWDRVPQISVTQVLAIELGGIEDGHIPREHLVNARRRGGIVHKITELHDKGGVCPQSIDARLQPYYDAYCRFLDRHKFTYDLIEHRFFMPHIRLAGCIDRGIVDDGIVDIKTGVFDEAYRLQVGGYAIGAGRTAHKRRLVMLGADGQFKMHTFPRKGESLMDDVRTFMSFLNAARWKIEKGYLAWP